MGNVPDLDVLDRIRRQYGELSHSFRKVADYVVEHYLDAAFLPAARWAAEAGVSESVVVRFSVALGYDGFPSLLHAVQALTRTRLSPPSRFQESLDWGAMEPNQILQQNMLLDEENLRQTRAEALNWSVAKVVDAVVSAERIYVLGLRGQAHLAGLMAFWLDALGYRAQALQQGDVMLFQGLRHFSKHDLLVVVAFPRYMRRNVEAIGLARTRGGRSVVITDSITSPEAQAGNFVLKVARESHSFMNSYTAALSVIHAIVTTCALRDPGRAATSLSELEAVVPHGDFFSI